MRKLTINHGSWLLPRDYKKLVLRLLDVFWGTHFPRRKGTQGSSVGRNSTGSLTDIKGMTKPSRDFLPQEVDNCFVQVAIQKAIDIDTFLIKAEKGDQRCSVPSFTCWLKSTSHLIPCNFSWSYDFLLKVYFLSFSFSHVLIYMYIYV